MRLAGLLAVIAGCNASGGQSAHTALTSEMVAGCYRFSWRRSDSLLQDRPFYPDLVRLGSESSCPQCESDAPAAKYLSLGSPLPDTARYVPGKPIPWYREFYASWWRIAVPDTVVVIFNGNRSLGRSPVPNEWGPQGASQLVGRWRWRFSPDRCHGCSCLLRDCRLTSA